MSNDPAYHRAYRAAHSDRIRVRVAAGGNGPVPDHQKGNGQIIRRNGMSIEAAFAAAVWQRLRGETQLVPIPPGLCASQIACITRQCEIEFAAQNRQKPSKRVTSAGNGTGDRALRPVAKAEPSDPIAALD